MEEDGRSQRWTRRLPEFKHSKRSPTAEDSKGDKLETKVKEEPQKIVTIATTSRYLTDRRYVMRKPLFSEEHHASILKMTNPQKLTEEKLLIDSRGEQTQLKYPSEPREPPISERRRLAHRDASLPSAYVHDLHSPLNGLRARSGHEEPGSGLPFSSRSLLQNLSRSILEVQRINPPLRPRLTSTVLHPTYTPRSRHSKSCGTLPGEFSVRDSSTGGAVSSHQVDFWACAIPKALPPSPNRHSAGWNADKEYESLLDYTYPLRPGHVGTDWDGSELQGNSFLKTNPNMEDSGIELDHLCSSTSLLDFSGNGEEKTRDGSRLNAGRSHDLQGFPRSSDGPPSSPPLSLTSPVALLLDSLDCSRDKEETSSPAGLSTSVCSTSVFPPSRCVSGEVDEDFWPLPDQLEELQQLSRQVREVTAHLTRPGTASSESLDLGTVFSYTMLPGTQQVDVKEADKDKEDMRRDGRERDRELLSAVQTGDNRDSGSLGDVVEPGGAAPSHSSVREVQALMKELCGPAFSGVQKNSQEQSDSLMQYIQVFCSHLELLIKQLYALSQKMEQLTAPSVDVDSVKSSLAEYQSFQKEVNNHQPLTSSVLHAGQLLLSCINFTSPFLRDTLLLIERQSGALQNHSDHLFSSILSAVDSLTQSTHSGVDRRTCRDFRL